MNSTSPSSQVDRAKLTLLNLIIYQLGLLLTDLLVASRATTDSTRLMQISNEYTAVQTYMFQATQAQLASDDAMFAQAAGVLRNQAGMLEGMEAQVKAIVSDVALAGRIVGYIVQVVSLVAKL